MDNILAASALIVYDHKILLLLRDNKPEIPYPNMWNFPGGIVEQGETCDEGMQRELREEIGIVPKQLIYIGTWHKPSGRIGKYYFSKLNETEAKSLRLGDEGQKLEFFDYGSLKSLSLPVFGAAKRFFCGYNDTIQKMLINEEPPHFNKLGLEP